MDPNDAVTGALYGSGGMTLIGLALLYGKRVALAVATVLWRRRGELAAEVAPELVQRFRVELEEGVVAESETTVPADQPELLAQVHVPVPPEPEQVRAMVELAVTKVMDRLDKEIERLSEELAELRELRATDQELIAELRHQIALKEARIEAYRRLLTANGIADTTEGALA